MAKKIVVQSGKKSAKKSEPLPDFYAFELKALDRSSTYTVHLSAQVLSKEGYEFENEVIALRKICEIIEQRINGKVAEDIFYKCLPMKLPPANPIATRLIDPEKP